MKPKLRPTMMGISLRHNVRLVGLAVAVIALPSIPVVATIQSSSRVQVFDPRPLAAVITELEKQHGWVVTYEDPVRVHPSDVADISAKYPSSRRRGPLLIPKGGAFEFSYIPPADQSDTSIRRMLNSLVEQYNRVSDDARFRVTRTGGIFHVLPATRRAPTGETQTSTSPLDTIISIPAAQRTGLEQLSAIREALRATSHPRFGLGIVPFGALHERLNGAVEGESARNAIVRVLDSSPYKLSYVLFCSPGAEPGCALSLHVIPVPTQ